MNFFNKYNLLNSNQCTNCSEAEENSVLYSAEYILKKRELGLSHHNEIMDYINFIELCKISKGLYNQTPTSYSTKDCYMSHDNLTAICSISYAFNFEYHKEIWKEVLQQSKWHYWFRYDNVNPEKPERYLHPRDVIYLGILNKNWLAYLCIPFLWFIMFYSNFHKYKYRGGNDNCKHDFVSASPSLSTCPKCGCRRYFSTDGKLLNWVRCKALGWESILWILELILKRHGPNFDNYKKLFLTYFNKEHPICKLWGK